MLITKIAETQLLCQFVLRKYQIKQVWAKGKGHDEKIH